MKLKQLLETKIKNKIAHLINVDQSYDIFLFSSCRSSIYSFFDLLNYSREMTKILLPDYVCNVVEKSIVLAGFKNILYYEINDNLLPNKSDLFSKIDLYNPEIVVFAPIFGSYGEEYYNIIKLVSESQNHPLILLDFAQDIDIPLPSFVDAAVTSFNKKSINGFFGGALIVKKNLPLKNPVKVKKISIYDEWIYLRHFLLDFLLKRISRILSILFINEKSIQVVEFEKNFEYSYCKTPPYLITNDEITFISSIVALFELSKIKKYQEIRKKNYSIIKKYINGIKGVKVIETERMFHSPYVPIYVEDQKDFLILLSLIDCKKVRWKNPYAKNSNPHDSFKVYLYAIILGYKEWNCLEDS